MSEKVPALMRGKQVEQGKLLVGQRYSHAGAGDAAFDDINTARSSICSLLFFPGRDRVGSACAGGRPARRKRRA